MPLDEHIRGFERDHEEELLIGAVKAWVGELQETMKGENHGTKSHREIEKGRQ